MITVCRESALLCKLNDHIVFTGISLASVQVSRLVCSWVIELFVAVGA